MSRDIQSIHGVWMQNLNWGYQVGHGNMVLAAKQGELDAADAETECYLVRTGEMR